MDGSELGEADLCVIHAPSHAAAPPLHMLQMVLASLHHQPAMRLGPLDGYYTANGWVVTLLSNASVSHRLTQPVAEESSAAFAEGAAAGVAATKRSGKGKHKTVLAAPPKPAHYSKQLLLIPSTHICFKFTSYRLVLCLDVSASTFLLDREGVVFFLLLECLLLTLAHVHQRICSEAEDAYGPKTAFISVRRPTSYVPSYAAAFLMYKPVSCIACALQVITHRPEVNETLAVWSGLLCRDTCLAALQSTVRARLETGVEGGREVGGLETPSPGSQRQPSADSYLRGALFHLRLLPPAAAPGVFLFTNAAMHVNASTATPLVSRALRCPMHVVVIECPRAAAPPGSRADAAALCALAAGSPGRGSGVVLRSRKDLDALLRAHFEVTDVLLHSPLCGGARCPSPCAALRLHTPAPLQLQLHSYSVYGVPLEHLLCLRSAEGFVVTAAVHVDARSAADGAPDRAPPRGMAITLQRFASKVQVLQYVVTGRAPRRALTHTRRGGYGTSGSSSSGAMSRQLQGGSAPSAEEFIAMARRVEQDGSDQDGSPCSLAWSGHGRLQIGLSVLCDEYALTSDLAFKNERVASTIKAACEDVISADRKAEVLMDSLGLSGSAAGILGTERKAAAKAEGTAHPRSTQASTVASLEETAELLAACDDPLCLQLLLLQSCSIGGGGPLGGGYQPGAFRAKALSSLPRARSALVGALAEALPDAEVVELSRGRLLLLCGRLGKAKTALDTVQALAGAVLVDLCESSNVFLTVRISKIAAAVGALNSRVIRIGCVVLQSLRARGICLQLCPQSSGELSLLSLLPGEAGRRAARACLQSARVQAQRTFLAADDKPQLSWALFCDLVDAKCSLGFQLADASIGGAVGSALCAHLVAITLCNPSGADTPSLLQCKVAVALDGLCVEYHWPKGCNETQYERGLALLSQASERASSTIEGLVSALMAQDKAIIRFYEIVDSIASRGRDGRPAGGQQLLLSGKDMCLLEGAMATELLCVPRIGGCGGELDESLAGAMAGAQGARAASAKLLPVSTSESHHSGHLVLRLVGDALVLVEIPTAAASPEEVPADHGEGEAKAKESDAGPQGDPEQCLFFSLQLRACALPARSFADAALREAAALALGGSCPAAAGAAAAAEARAAVRRTLVDDNSANFVRIVHRALSEGVPVPPGSVNLATSRCLQTDFSVDMSAMLRRGGLSRNPAAVQASFERLLGSRLRGLSGGEVYTTGCGSSEVAFVRLSVVCKPTDDLTSALVYPVRSSVHCFAQALVDICASIHSIIESAEVLLSVVYLSVAAGGAAAAATSASVDAPSTGPASQLCAAVREFVAGETLLALQASPDAATTESLLLAHDLLVSDCPDAARIELSLPFIAATRAVGRAESPARPSRGEPPVAALLEAELLARCTEMRKGAGDLLYARTWRSDGGLEAEPAWILVSLSGQTQQAGAPVAVVRASALLLRLGGGGPAHIEQGVRDLLEQCCHTINQRSLLHELYATRMASPFLLAPSLSSGEKEAAKAAAGRAGPRARLPIPTPLPFAKSNRTAAAQLPPTVTRPEDGEAAEPLFKHGHFQCSRRGLIEVSNYAFGAVPVDAAQRHLETSALAQLAVLNRDRLFVFQDAHRRVFYMAFDEPAAGGRSLRLGVFGASDMDESMRAQMQALLRHRLTEITAKTISAALARKSSVPSAHLAFLRDGDRDGSKPSSLLFALPQIVHDMYYFCVIAKQVLLASTVLGRLVVAGEEKTKRKDGCWPSASEVVHPSWLGYDLAGGGVAAAAPASSALLTRSTSHPMLLERKAHVEEEAVLPSNPRLVHPVFFGVQRGLARRKTAPTGGLVAWHQNDFSLLYNLLGPSPAHASIAHRGAIKLIGQGLALLELAPVFAGDRLLAAGARAEGGVAGYLQQLTALLAPPAPEQQEQRLCLQLLQEGEQPPAGCSRLVLRVYPTVPMQTHALFDFCAACLNQALAVYCIERLFGAGAAEGSEGGWSWAAARPHFRRAVGLLERPPSAAKAPATLAPALGGSLRVRYKLSRSSAAGALQFALQRLLLAHPLLEETLLADEEEPSAVMGDFRPVASGAMTEYRLMSDGETANPNPNPLLRTRRFAIELSLHEEEVVVTHFNASSALVACAADAVAEALAAAAEEDARSSELQSSQEVRQEEAQQLVHGERERLLADQASRLVWERRVQRRLLSASETAPHEQCLDTIPLEAWRRGAARSSALLTLPPSASGSAPFESYAMALQRLCRKSDCEFVDAWLATARSVLLVACVPRSALVSVTEVILQEPLAVELRHSVCSVENLLLEHLPLSKEQEAAAAAATEHPAVLLWRRRVLQETVVYTRKQMCCGPAPRGLLQQSELALQALQAPLEGQLLSATTRATSPLPLATVALQWLRTGCLPLCYEEGEEGGAFVLCLPFCLEVHPGRGGGVTGLCFIRGASGEEREAAITVFVADVSLLKGGEDVKVAFAAAEEGAEEGGLLQACVRSVQQHISAALGASSAQLSARRSWDAVFGSAACAPEEVRALMRHCEYCAPVGALGEDAHSLLALFCERSLQGALQEALSAAYGSRFLRLPPPDLDEGCEAGCNAHSCCGAATYLLVSAPLCCGFAVLLALCPAHGCSATVVHDRSSAAAAEAGAASLLSDVANIMAHTAMQRM